MKVEKVLTRVLMAFLALLIAASLLKINFKSGVISQAENRYLAEFPDVFTEAGELNSDLMNDMKQWFSDNLGFRDEYIKLSSNIQYKLLNDSPSEKVEIGRDGWFFYTLDNNLDIARGEYPLFDEETVADICDIQVRIQQKLKEQGIEYVLVLPPSKVSVYPEYIASGDYSVIKTPADILADYLEEHTDIKVVRLKEALLEEKENRQLYYKTDTHWNQYGAYVGYRELIRKMNEWGITSREPVEVTLSESQERGEFSSMMGDPMLLDPEPCPRIELPVVTTQLITSGEKYDRFHELLRVEGLNNPSFMYENELTDLPKALMLGDSMFGQFVGWTATEMLAQNFSEFTFVWDTHVRQNFLDTIKPDVVIFEMTERLLNTLIIKSLPFALDRLPEYSAQILGYEVKDGDLYVTVQNTGAYPWTRDNQIKLCLWKNDGDWSKRASLPRDVQIDHADTYTFCFKDIDENELFNNKIEATMLHEGICYFGEKRIIIEKNTDYRKNDAEIVSHDTPASVNHTDSYVINITVKNTGNLAWSESTQHKLVIYQDGIDWGHRITLPPDKIVMPGEEYTFTLNGFILPQAESTYLEYQMIQEGIEYFGERERADITAQ